MKQKSVILKGLTSSTTLVLPFESVEGAFQIEIGVN